jgi:hypothetical protein
MNIESRLRKMERQAELQSPVLLVIAGDKAWWKGPGIRLDRPPGAELVDSGSVPEGTKTIYKLVWSDGGEF